MIDTRSLSSRIGTIKNPSYTGENRCLPCTAVNVVLAVGISIAAAALADGGLLRAGVFSTLFAGSILVIYVRGYLVPGTPRLTKRYLPDSVLAVFDKVDEPAEGPFDPEAELRSVGIVEADPQRGDLVLAPPFDRSWRAAIAERAATDEDLRVRLANVMGLDPTAIEFEERATSFVAYHEDEPIAKWESRAACRADAAAAAILPRFDSRWHGRSIVERMDLLGALRLFLEECPACGGQVSLSHEVVESCCRSRDVVATTCDSCTVRLFETPVDADALDPAEPATA